MLVVELTTYMLGSLLTQLAEAVRVMNPAPRVSGDSTVFETVDIAAATDPNALAEGS
jgi:hypothetical protein